ncbi:MAG: hypothetical protein COV48_02440 [Elusimicrobia bacterium CG11_big_fil_rev_8_21_14_0_20_64_6]|nr:MAG: hypothetical protein COV48_02440 [Elusimicrobia bacterium CG11_big_fil_rev_8_21_14_0_20_64_6]
MRTSTWCGAYNPSLTGRGGEGILIFVAKYTKEARRARRYPHDSVLEIFSDSDSMPVDVARLIDVSALGLSFTTTRVYAKGAPIHARMRLLNTGVLEIRGTIVRIKEKTNCTLYGVKYDSVRGNHPWPSTP